MGGRQSLLSRGRTRHQGVRLAGVLFFVWVTLAIGSAAWAQGWNVERVSQLGGADYAVHIQGNYAYVIDGPNLRIVDLSDPLRPTAVGELFLRGSTDIAVSGNLAYVPNWDQGLLIVDVSNPSTPTIRGSFDTPDWAYGVFVSGNTAYVADDESGLQIIDVTNPSSPTLAGSYDTPGRAWGVFVSDNFAYVADWGSGLQIIDVTNPSAPVHVGSFDTPGEPWAIYVSGTLAYVADDGGGLQILDVSDPSAPTLTGSYGAGGAACDVFVSGNLAYVTDYGNGLRIIDVSDPSSPTLAGFHEAPGARGVFVSGHEACVASDATGLWILRYTGPGGPPATPADFRAAASWGQVGTSWRDRSANEDGFRLERRTGTTGAWDTITTAAADITFFLDTNVVADAQYSYRVQAFNAVGNSFYSNEAVVRVPVPLPPASVQLPWRLYR